MAIICIKCNNDILDKLTKERNDIIFIQEEWDLQNVVYSPAVISRLLFEYRVIKLDSVEELSAIYADIISKNIKIDKVICGAEYGIFAAGFLNTLLTGESSHSKLAITARDKRLMKKLFSEIGVNCAKICPSYSLADLENNISHGLDYPIVAKPATGTGTFNTVKINNEEELISYFKQLKLHPAIYSQIITLEEYISGEEYHVDIIWKNGECKFISISKDFIPRIEILKNPKLNGSYVLDPKKNQGLFEYIESKHILINEKLGFKDGVTHTEFFVREDGEIYFSEIAIRYGGASIPEMIYNATGVNIIDAWMLTELGLPFEVKDNQHDFRFTAHVDFIPEEHGLVKNIPTKEELMNIPWIKDVTIRLKPDTIYNPNNPSDYAVLCIIEGDDEQDIMRKIDTLYEKFKIQICKI